MKHLLLCFLLVTASFAAQGPAQLDAPRLVSISALPVYADDGAMESLNVTAKFTVLHLQPDGKTKKRHVITVTFDLIEAGSQNVAVGTPPVVYDFDELAAGLVAACVKRFFQDHPPPLPVRKALRVQPQLNSP